MKSLRCLFGCALWWGSALVHAETAAASSWPEFLAAALHGRTECEPQDGYKLLVQATLGAEHAAPSEAAALAWMEREVATLEPAPDEPMVESITPDGSLVRVNLRPFLARGGDWRALARAFAATGRRKFGTREDLAARWEMVVTLAQDGRLPFAAAAAREFGRAMAEKGFPAVHHSKRYAAAYRPAYRVIAKELLAEALPKSP